MLSCARPLAIGLILGAAPAAAAPRVAVDIAPVHSIVSAVMSGVGAPDLILPPGASPHGHALRPSEAEAVAGADLVVWVGPALTPWLAHPIESLGSGAAQLELLDAPGLALLQVREDAAFEAHDHGDEADHDQDAHDHEAHDHEHDEADTEHADDHDHEHDAIDAHVWLDPANAVAIASAVAVTLAETDPENAARYEANARAFADRAAGLDAQVEAVVAPVRGKRFIVFHDAYQYFEHAFEIPASGAISLTDGQAPSPGRVAALRTRLIDEGAVCVFSEPQFEPKLIATIIEGTPVRTGVLDPIGADLTPGPDLYPALIAGIATSLAGCLEG